MKLALALAALGATAASLAATPATVASTPVDGPDGPLCGFTAVAHEATADPHDMAGEVDAGPAVTNVPGTLVCTIRLNVNDHVGPAAAAHEFPAVNGVIAGVDLLWYSSTPDAYEYMCTSFRQADGTMLYYSSGAGAHWHTDPGKPCSVSGPPPDLWDVIDATTCPRLAANEGAFQGTTIDYEGDVFVDQNASGGTTEAEAVSELVYDCPVYTFSLDDDSNPDAAHNARTNTASMTPKVID